MSHYHERRVNTWRSKWRSLFLAAGVPPVRPNFLLRAPYRLRVKLATFLFLSALAFAQTNPRSKASTSDNAVCPLSDAQSQKSIDAFANIAKVLLGEPRCLNCHGGVNPFVEGVDPDGAPTAHGGGKMDPPVEDNTGKVTSKGTDCESCHDDMVPKRNGFPSKWELAPSDDYFYNNDERYLCRHMRKTFQEVKDLLGHFKDDNGMDIFVGTAFRGNRGLTAKDQEKGFTLQPPRITHAGLIGLGNSWGATSGGEFKGDIDCGCEETHFAILISTSTEINLAGIHHSSVMRPVTLPITFNDDGTFSGDGEGTYEAGGAVEGCAEQSSAGVKFHVSGKATEQFQNNSMHIDLEFPAPITYNFSAECPDDARESLQANVPVMKVKAFFDMKGTVGEKFDRTQDSMPGVLSKMHLEIVRK